MNGIIPVGVKVELYDHDEWHQGFEVDAHLDGVYHLWDLETETHIVADASNVRRYEERTVTR